MASVSVRGLKKRFNSTLAVDGVSFEVPEGGFLSLLGPPGAGKTTTLRMLAGLEKPDEGEVWIGGVLVNEVHPKDRDVALVFEDLALYPHWTGFDNIAHPLRLRKLPPEEIDARVREVAEMLHITHLLNRLPGTYSGGERRRVAIGRALVRRPRVLLLDEPLTDLDAKIRQEMTGELKRLQNETGQTTIYATHDYEEALAMADSVVVLKAGRVGQVGTPEEIYDYPMTAFVASLTGSPSMNLIPAQAARGAEGWEVRHPAFRLSLTADLEGFAGGDVLLGVRPEHVELVEPSAPSAVQGRVEISQMLGDEQILDVRLSEDTVLKVVVPATPPVAPGSNVSLRLPEDRVFLYDATGENLVWGPARHRT